MKKKCFFKVITITKQPVNKISTCRRSHTESIQPTSFSVMCVQEWMTAAPGENPQCCKNQPVAVCGWGEKNVKEKKTV